MIPKAYLFWGRGSLHCHTNHGFCGSNVRVQRQRPAERLRVQRHHRPGVVIPFSCCQILTLWTKAWWNVLDMIYIYIYIYIWIYSFMTWGWYILWLEVDILWSSEGDGMGETSLIILDGLQYYLWIETDNVEWTQEFEYHIDILRYIYIYRNQ